MTDPKDAATPDLEKKRRAFRRIMAARDSALQELASTVGFPDPASAPDQLDRLLDAVDAFLATLDTRTLNDNHVLWLQSRCSFVVGELLRQRHGGTWFLQEDPKEHFYLTPVVGGFDNDPSVTVSPPAIVRKVFSHSPPGSLRQEIAKLGLDHSDTAPLVEPGMMSGRHRSMVPKIRCTCGRALWDFAGGHGGKAAWLPCNQLSGIKRHLADRIGAWLASCEDGHRDAFVQHVLGMDPDDEGIDNLAVVGELVSRVLAQELRSAFECEGCGRIWVQAIEGDFVPYSPDTDRRYVFEEPEEPAGPDSVRISVDTR